MYEDSDENLAGFLARAKGRASSPPWRLLADARRPTPTKRLPNGGAEYAADALERAAFGFSDTGAVPAPNYEEAPKPCGDHAEYERLYAEVHEPLRSRLGQLKTAVLR
ncbi:MAG: hypothetical protein AVDCRST_MAG55-505 [uncultured Rubrobacteraceae bacterium]|uniref:Uncharacterized protein n=1 Tax=uncultured Rubrobacteraceae bacterium TaxID=349277 RepID=A0A6J4NVF7_9ACTN|nr:MAG: hypothetical protein AVDCRST_MAG55-505 [uncultured Rubrobacteraceae bacterium]